MTADDLAGGVRGPLGSDDDSGLVYGLEFHCRALCACAAETEAPTFMVGTQGLKKAVDNQVRIEWLTWTVNVLNTVLI